MTFLTKDLVLLAQNSPEYDGYVIFEVWSLDAKAVLGRCKLPLPADKYLPWFISHPASNHSGQSPTKHARLFVPDPRIEILGIIFRSTPAELGMEIQTVTVALSIHLFTQKFASLTKKAIEENVKDIPVFEWNDWGPPVTRWLPSTIRGNIGIRTAFGARMLAIFIEPLPEGDAGIPMVYTTLLDFNPRPIARGSVDDDTNDYSLRVYDEEDEWAAGNISVTSGLPYRAWFSNRRCSYSSFFLDGNTIIGSWV